MPAKFSAALQSSLRAALCRGVLVMPLSPERHNAVEVQLLRDTRITIHLVYFW